MDYNYFTETALDDNILGHSRFMKSVINNEYDYIKKILHKLSIADLQEVLNLRDAYGNDPLMLAIQNEHFKLAKYFLEKFPSIIDFETMDNMEDTALFMAIKKNNKDLVKDLVSNGASLTTQDANGNNALAVAVYYNASMDIIEYLILYGANPRARNFANESAANLFDNYRLGDDSDIDFATFIQNLKTERDLAVRQIVVEKGHGRMIKDYLGFKSRKRVTKSVKKSRKRVTKSVKKSRKRITKSVKKSRKRVTKK